MVGDTGLVARSTANCPNSDPEDPAQLLLSATKVRRTYVRKEVNGANGYLK